MFVILIYMVSGLSRLLVAGKFHMSRLNKPFGETEKNPVPRHYRFEQTEKDTLTKTGEV